MSEQDVSRIVDLLIRLRENGLSAEENTELQAWILRNRELFEELNNHEMILAELRDDDLSVQKIFTTIRSRGIGASLSGQAPIRNINFKSRLIAAAVILILVSTGTYFWLHKSPSHESDQASLAGKKYQADLPPGGNRAVLKLANGSTIILDSAHNGLLSKEGGANIEKKDGKLSYHSLPEKPTEIQFNTLMTPRGGQYAVKLSDGSVVWLNAASYLRYPASFSGKRREVELKGEAYFEVAPSTHPFVVNILPSATGVGGGRVEVLGTQFNINAYEDEAVMKTTLLEGAVKFSIGEKEQGVRLEPGQQAQVITGKIKVLDDADVGEVVSWKNGITSFKDADIKSIMRKVARWYDVDVVYQGEIPERTFMGGITRTSKLSELLTVLELSNIHFELTGKTLLVKP